MKKKWVKILSICFVAAVFVAAAVIMIVESHPKDELKRREHSISPFYEDAAGATRFYYDGELLSDQISGRIDSFLSCDGTVGIARAGASIYSIDATGVYRHSYAGVLRAALSLDNSVIVFTTATQVHIHNLLTSEDIKLEPEGAKSIPSIAVSNDGTAVGYTVKTSDDRYAAYAYVNGESVKLADNAFVLAIAGAAERVWYVEPETATLYYSGKSIPARKAAENISGLIEFNKDLTEAIFDVAGVTYCSKKGGTAKVLVDGLSVYSTKPECASAQGGEAYISYINDCSTLFDCVFYSSFSSSEESSKTAYNLYFIDSYLNTKKLALGATEFMLSGDGKKLAVMIDRNLYLMDREDPGTAQMLAENAYSFSMTRDASRFWCIGNDTGLYIVEAGKSPELVASNVTRTVVTDDGKCLFMKDYGTSVGDLCTIGDDGEVRVLLSGVSYYELTPTTVFCYSGDYENEFGSTVFDVYSSSDGLEYALTLKGALRSSSEN